MKETPTINNNSSWRRILSWLSVIVWAALIFYLSSRSDMKVEWGILDLFLRKSAHMAEFAVMCFLVWNAIRQKGYAFGRALTLAATVSLLYAFSDELHQRYVPGRIGTLRDVGFDAAGIMIMSLIIIALRQKRTARAESPIV